MYCIKDIQRYSTSFFLPPPDFLCPTNKRKYPIYLNSVLWRKLPQLISKSGLHKNNIRSITPTTSFEFRANLTSSLSSTRVPSNWRTLPVMAEHIVKHCWLYCFDDVMKSDSRKRDRLEMIQICSVIITPEINAATRGDTCPWGQKCHDPKELDSI